MKNRAVGAARSRYCVYVVDRADFIVYCHHGHHQHVVAHHSFERVWIDVAPRIDWDVFDLEGELISKRAARSQNALMFGLAEENPASVSSARSSCQSQEGEVVGFGRTRGEDDLVGVCAEEVPNLFCRIGNSLRCTPAFYVVGRVRIPKYFNKIGIDCR